MEKWQIALERWDKWFNSVRKTKALVKDFINKENFADLEQLLSSIKSSYKIHTYWRIQS